MSDEAKPIDNPRDVPTNLSDEEHMKFLMAHGVSEEFLESTEEVPEEERPRTRTRPINVRIDDFTLGRLKALAESRNVGYQTLLKEFVIERLYEEERRQGVLPPGQMPEGGSSRNHPKSPRNEGRQDRVTGNNGSMTS
jgi:hypothetical protein